MQVVGLVVLASNTKTTAVHIISHEKNLISFTHVFKDL